MPSNARVGAPPSNCELFAITVGDAWHPPLLQRFPAAIASADRMARFLGWQRASESAEMDKETAGMFALETSTR
jgi:hypothetical protein